MKIAHRQVRSVWLFFTGTVDETLSGIIAAAAGYLQYIRTQQCVASESWFSENAIYYDMLQ